MRVRISAFVGPLTVQFEPSGMEYELAEGDHLDVAFPPVPEGQVGGHIDHSPGMVTVSESISSKGWTRAWNAAGEEITTY
ncbi:hypothetical protein ACGFZQ_20620 [Streptomyces sp. NPDC048254]|uniref:hypothetical protein n=1 Tax=Streptomyces sp. NPDC048254 TaxID=3365525 RepID=UPI00371D70C2